MDIRGRLGLNGYHFGEWNHVEDAGEIVKEILSIFIDTSEF